MRVPGAVVWFDKAVEDLACRRSVLSRDDIDLALVKAGLGVDVVPDDPDTASGIKEDLDADDSQSTCEPCGIQWGNDTGRHDAEDMEEVT